jgi:thioredoxin-related protein
MKALSNSKKFLLVINLAIFFTLLMCIVPYNISESKASTTIKSKKGILVVIGGFPSCKWGAKFIENQIPDSIKNNYIILSRNWEIIRYIGKLKADIKKQNKKLA